eukprot:Nk52_evm27s2309 gene=Nk52_evmTU27s2309
METTDKQMDEKTNTEAKSVETNLTSGSLDIFNKSIVEGVLPVKSEPKYANVLIEEAMSMDSVPDNPYHEKDDGDSAGDLGSLYDDLGSVGSAGQLNEVMNYEERGVDAPKGEEDHLTALNFRKKPKKLSLLEEVLQRPRDPIEPSSPMKAEEDTLKEGDKLNEEKKKSGSDSSLSTSNVKIKIGASIGKRLEEPPVNFFPIIPGFKDLLYGEELICPPSENILAAYEQVLEETQLNVHDPNFQAFTGTYIDYPEDPHIVSPSLYYGEEDARLQLYEYAKRILCYRANCAENCRFDSINLGLNNFGLSLETFVQQRSIRWCVEPLLDADLKDSPPLASEVQDPWTIDLESNKHLIKKKVSASSKKGRLNRRGSSFSTASGLSGSRASLHSATSSHRSFGSGTGKHDKKGEPDYIEGVCTFGRKMNCFENHILEIPMEGTVQYKTCYQCRGIGGYDCNLCRREGIVNCRKGCRKRTKAERSERICGDCNGTGSVQKKEFAAAATCKSCMGIGKYVCKFCANKGVESCWACVEGARECSVCAGSGHVKIFMMLCVKWVSKGSMMDYSKKYEKYLKTKGHLITRNILGGKDRKPYFLTGLPGEVREASMEPDILFCSISPLLANFNEPFSSRELVKRIGELIEEHIGFAGEGLVVCQRLKVVGYPIYEIYCSYREQPFNYYVHGPHKELYERSYPESTCCSIL